MDLGTSHRRTRWVSCIAARSVGVWLVTAILFTTFVNAEDARTHPLATGSWLTAVALSGIFCAAWVARDTALHGPRTLTRVWAASLLLVVVALTVAALLTGTERARGEGADVASAVTTSSLVGVGLGVAALLGWLCGRAVAQSARQPPVED